MGSDPGPAGLQRPRARKEGETRGEAARVMAAKVHTGTVLSAPSVNSFRSPDYTTGDE